MLAKAEVQYVIGGSLASSAWGQERTTRDADLAVLLDEKQLKILDTLIAWPYIMDTDSIQASLAQPKEFSSGQILNGETLDKVDLFLLTDSPYTQARLANRRYIEVAPGVSLPFSSPEDTVITKLRWFVLGNKVSDRQWNDIVQILEMQSGKLDESYLIEWATHFSVLELLREAKNQVSAEQEP